MTLMLWGLPAFGQTGSGGSIEGTITDQMSAVIAGADISVTNTDTGVTAHARSTSAGFYSVPSLIPGVYTVQVGKSGFKSYIQKNVQVNALDVIGLNIKLTLGEAVESVTVTTAPPTLDTENASLNTTMENETYTDLPLTMNKSQRDPTAFAALAPGAGGGGRLGTFNNAGGVGSDSDSGVVVYVDGVQFSQGDNRPLALAVSVDAVDQFQVTTAGANAAQTGLGSENFNIKHGTNKFHGSAFEYLRNTALDSWNFNAKAVTITQADGTKVQQPKPAEHQNEMGITFGGPIRKDKIFNFLSGELYRYTAFVNPYYKTVPTAAMRTGDFSALSYPIYDPNTLSISGSTYKVTQFSGNIIPSNRISTIAKNMMQFLPEPNISGTFTSNLLTTHPTGNDNYEVSDRFDYVLNQRHRISVLGNSGKEGFIGYDYASNSTLPLPYVDATLVSEFYNSLILEHTYIVSSNIVNQFKVGYVRTNTPIKNPSEQNSSLYSAAKMGIGNLPAGDATNAFPNVTFTGGQYGSDEWYSPGGQVDLNDQLAIHDDFSWAHGKHLITGGLDFLNYEKNFSSWNGQGQRLSLTFNSNNTAGFVPNKSGTNLASKTGDPTASFLLGDVYSTSVTVQPFSTLGDRYKTFSPFVQDDWKVKPNLTLNLGLRWDLYPVAYEVQNRGSFMDPSLTNPLTGNLGAYSFLGNGTGRDGLRSPGSTYFGNIGPRVGLAYTVYPKTVIRAGFGISYGHNGSAASQAGTSGFTTTTNYATSVGNEQPEFCLNDNAGCPFASNPSTGPNTSLPAWSNTFTLNPGMNTGNYLVSGTSYAAPGSATMAAQGTTVRVPTVYNWNLGVEQSLTNKLVFSLSYVATVSHFIGSKKSYMGTDAKYNVIGQYLSQVPTATDTATGQTYLADAQARFAGIQLPYSSYGGSTGTISHMLQRFPQYSSTSQIWGPYANADYHSLQAVLRQQEWHGLTYSANLVFGKAMGNTGSYRANGDYIPGNVMYGGQGVRTNKIEHSFLSTDQRVVFKAYGEYKLPFGRGSWGGSNFYVRQVAGGWKLSGIYTIGTGSPLAFSPSTLGYNPNFSGPIRINGSYGKGYLAGMSTSTAPRYIDVNGFVLVPKYMIGNVPNYAPYNLRTAKSTNINMAVQRTFPVWRGSQFMLRGEVFNLTNHVQFGAPSVSWPSDCGYATTVVDFGQGGGTCTLSPSDTFGQVSSQSNSSRDWQLSGKINF